MNQIMTFPVSEALPPRNAVLNRAGIPTGAAPAREVEAALDAALRGFTQTARPVGILLEIPRPDFQTVYDGQGYNEPRTPVGDMLPHVDAIALFAVTVGENVCEGIRDLFAANDFVVACMLDAIASEAADLLATCIARRFLETVCRNGRLNATATVLPYSPGYCGWHITGQRRLFERLRPEQIGISLNSSCLMTPLKSVSGVAIIAPRELHCAANSYPFCRDCETRTCRERSPMGDSVETLNNIQR